MKNILYLILDGLGDRPIAEFQNQTPLESAQTPNLDNLAKRGAKGFLEPSYQGKFPTSVEGHLSLFGYDIDKMETGRGVFEALGVGLELKPDEVALRANFATLDKDGKVIDRRAGRIKDSSQLAKALSGIKIQGVEFSVYNSISHRAVIVITGKGLSKNIIGNDSHQKNIEPLPVQPKDNSQEAKFTAELLNQFLTQAKEILENHPLNKQRKEKGLLPANYLLVREASQRQAIESFNDKWKMKSCAIAGGKLYKGIARILKMDLIEVDGATGQGNTDIEAKFKAAIKALENDYQFCYLHIKATDIFSHDKDCQGKKRFIEKVDKNLPLLSENKETILVITGDHSTPCAIGEHTGEPVPFIVCPSPGSLTDKPMKMIQLLPKLVEFAKL